MNGGGQEIDDSYWEDLFQTDEDSSSANDDDGANAVVQHDAGTKQRVPEPLSNRTPRGFVLPVLSRLDYDIQAVQTSLLSSAVASSSKQIMGGDLTAVTNDRSKDLITEQKPEWNSAATFFPPYQPFHAASLAIAHTSQGLAPQNNNAAVSTANVPSGAVGARSTSTTNPLYRNLSITQSQLELMAMLAEAQPRPLPELTARETAAHHGGQPNSVLPMDPCAQSSTNPYGASELAKCQPSFLTGMDERLVSYAAFQASSIQPAVSEQVPSSLSSAAIWPIPTNQLAFTSQPPPQLCITSPSLSSMEMKRLTIPSEELGKQLASGPMLLHSDRGDQLRKSASLQQAPSPPAFEKRRTKRKYQHEAFPQKLYRILVDAERNGESHIISFTSSGEAFRVHDPRSFARDIIPRYFRHNQYHSFQRQLCMYNFERIVFGQEVGAYTHPLLRKGRPDLCAHILRVTDMEDNHAEQQSAGPNNSTQLPK